MKRIILLLYILLACCTMALGHASVVRAQQPVVRAVLFYSPTCPHCEQVIAEDLPPIFEKYGERLQIVGVDTYTEGGQALFQAAIEQFNIPAERQAVPTLIIDDLVLVGSQEIPEQFPGLVDVYLAQGGVDWPAVPGLVEALEAARAQLTATPGTGSQQAASPPATPLPSAAAPTQPAAGASAPQPTAASGMILTEESSGSIAERIARDPVGNLLAIVVLIGMLVSLGAVVVFLLSKGNARYLVNRSLAIPVLCLVGFAIASYLTYVESAQVTAVCGPVGDCNTVQQSEYALLFGVFPIGGLGMAGYLAILLAWLASRWGSGRSASLASLALLGMALLGTLFSIYLTFLEPFVIGATCAWCLSSAVIMTALLWLSMFPGKGSLLTLWYGESNPYTRTGQKSAVRSSRNAR